MAVHADSVAVVQQARVFCAKLGAFLQVWDYPREPERVPGYFKTAMSGEWTVLGFDTVTVMPCMIA